MCPSSARRVSLFGGAAAAVTALCKTNKIDGVEAENGRIWDDVDGSESKRGREEDFYLNGLHSGSSSVLF